MRTAPSIRTPERCAAVVRESVLRATVALRSGRTVLTGRYHTAPVKIAKTFALPSELGIMVMDVSPGMLPGDVYYFEWNIEAGAHLYASNQSFTKVHPCAEGEAAAMRQSFRLAQNAVAESMMEPLMLYKDASFSNETEVFLSEGAVWMQAEVICPGRLHRGEAFQYRKLDNRLRVYSGGELIFHQRQVILPGEQRLFTAGAWEDQSHLGTFYVFSDRITPAQLETVREAIALLPERPGRPVLAGASLTHQHGLAVIAASGSAWTVQETLRQVWFAVRQSLLGLPPLRLL
jgi:urease accessory protein